MINGILVCVPPAHVDAKCRGHCRCRYGNSRLLKFLSAVANIQQVSGFSVSTTFFTQVVVLQVDLSACSAGKLRFCDTKHRSGFPEPSEDTNPQESCRASPLCSETNRATSCAAAAQVE